MDTLSAHDTMVQQLVSRGATKNGFSRWVKSKWDIEEYAVEMGMDSWGMDHCFKYQPDAWKQDAENKIVSIFEVVVTSPVSLGKWGAYAEIADFFQYYGWNFYVVHIHQQGLWYKLDYGGCLAAHTFSESPRAVVFKPECQIEPFQMFS
jgi:hypothetical protein